MFRIVAVSGAICVALLIGEVIILLSGVNNHYRQPATSMIIPREGGPYELSEWGFVPFGTIRMEYVTNPRGYFDAQGGIDHHFNSEGWRDEEHLEQPEPETFRILGLGDSYLMGQGVKREDLCLTQLEDWLNERLEDSSVETINTGQAAYNTWMEWQVLKKRGLDYQPDLVLLSFVPNDVEPDVFTDDPKVEFLTEFTNSYVIDDWLTPHSELWFFVKRKVAMQFLSRRYLDESIGSYRDDPEKWERCRSAILGIQETCREHEIKFAVVLWPFFVNLNGDYPFQSIHDQVRETCESEGTPVLDLRETFRTYEGPELWVHPTDQHPNEDAHRIAAPAIGEFLLPRIHDVTDGESH